MSEHTGEDVPTATAANSELDDLPLVRRAKRGDRDAFGRLVERYQRRATTTSWRLLGDLHDALEAVQEAFIRAYANLAALEDEARFGPWFMRIVTNLSLNYRRGRAVRQRTASLEDCVLRDGEQSPDEVAEAPMHSDDRPGAQLGAMELSEHVQRALDDLPEQQRMALVLFSVEQMPQKDVAEMLGMSVEAVKWHVFQARRKLKERLAEWL
ncbi:MAG: RNA polymerase sigma factor [Phycisphaerales bacterium]|nr:RNA polymerase sigma factor [Phycisphaerales bacterium]